MSENPVISVQGVSKAYRIWESPSARLIAPLLGYIAKILPGVPGRWLQTKASRSFRDFWALKDITFEVRKGESFGLIGRNGSGKSTLLQIIAGTLQPTTGSVKVNGRVAALLELGSGFNPEFTGRENVILNGAILGFTGTQMEAKFAEIAAFADIGEFINQPVKIYSSGMMLRLAFAVQTAVDPDVLIIDEALSVGDAPFQAKCFARIRHLQGRGCSILFVSHDIGTIRTFCQHAVWLMEGQPQSQGEVQVDCDAYARECARATGMDFPESSSATDSKLQASPSKERWMTEDRSEFAKMAALDRHGSGPLQIKNFLILNSLGERCSSIRWDETITAIYIVGTNVDFDGLFQVGLLCRTLQGQELLSCSDRTHDLRLSLSRGKECTVSLQTHLPLRAGKYSITIGLFLFPNDARYESGTFDFTRATVADYVTQSTVIEILPQFSLGIYGPVHQEASLSINLP